MNNRSISLSIEDTRSLLLQIQKFRDQIESNWTSIICKWQNLQSTWNDNGFYKFEPIFTDLCNSYDKCINQQEEYIHFLENILLASENAIQICSSSEQINLRSSYVIPSSVQQIQASNKEPTDFAKSLKYGLTYSGSKPCFDQGIYEVLEAVLPNGVQSDCRISYRVDGLNRIRITNIDVPNAYQKQGIGTLLFKNLESQAPFGTIFYFVENLATEFWKKQGFNLHKNDDGISEFRKESSKE